MGGQSESPLVIIASVCLLFAIGTGGGLISSFIMKTVKNKKVNFVLLLFFLCLVTAIGIVVDIFVFHAFKLNCILIGMSFSAVLVNLIPAEKTEEILAEYNGILNLSLVVVIVNLGMPLDYRLIAGADCLRSLIFFPAPSVRSVTLILAEKL